MAIQYTCKECGAVNDVYILCVSASWNPEYQAWDVVPNDKASDKQCGNCNSWKIEEQEDES